MIELVKKEEVKGIWASNMKGGDVGVIVGHSNAEYLGRIVQRYNRSLITVGTPCFTWSSIFSLCNDFRVRLLEKGETLIVV